VRTSTARTVKPAAFRSERTAKRKSFQTATMTA
jgi:hypothetical protein